MLMKPYNFVTLFHGNLQWVIRVKKWDIKWLTMKSLEKLLSPISN